MYEFTESEKKFMVECLQDLYERLKKIVHEDFWRDMVCDLSPCALADQVGIDVILNGQSDDATEYFSFLTELLDIAIADIEVLEDALADSEAAIKDMQAEVN